jgi:ABC-2 type transport system permease protein
MNSVAALYLAQARQFLRDRMTVLFVLLLPVGFGVFFGLIFSGGSGNPIHLGTVNEDAGGVGQAILEGMRQGGLSVEVDTFDRLSESLGRGEVQAVLVFPENLTANMASELVTTIDVYYDSASAMAGATLGTVRSMLGEANLRLSAAPRLLDMQERSVHVEQIRSIDFYLPGMLGVALLWLGVFGTAQPVVAQRESQILRRFQVTSISRQTILAAEVGWRVTVGLLQAGIFVLVGYFGFQVGIVRWLPFLGAVLMGALVFVSLGYTIAGLGRTMESAMGIGQLLNFPMMMLSGSMFSAEMLPAFFRPIVSIMPLTYLSDLLRQTMVGAPGARSMAIDFAVLGAWLVLLLAAATWLWRWE